MTGALDETFGDLSVELIAEFGKAIAYTRVTAGIYNTATAKTANVERRTMTNAICESVNGRTFTGNAIFADDMQITVAAENFHKPELMDYFEVDGSRYSIADNGIKPIYSGELVCLWIMHGHKT